MPDRRNEKNRAQKEAGSPADPATLEPERIRNALLPWGRENFADFPWRDPDRLWHGLLAEVLLQRTRAKTTVIVYRQFVERYPEARNLGEAPLQEVRELVYPLGLNWRAPLIQKLGQELAELGGVPPHSVEELKSLPGVGDYAAAAYLGFHGGRRAVIVDANVVRWICRMLDTEYDGETRRKKWLRQTADMLTPETGWREYNYAVLDFTMQICGTKPLCSMCPLGASLCRYGQRMLSGQNEAEGE